MNFIFSVKPKYFLFLGTADTDYTSAVSQNAYMAVHGGVFLIIEDELRDSTSCTRMHLQELSLNEMAGQHLARALAQNDSVKHLTITDCEIPSSCLRSLAPKVSSLEYFDLSNSICLKSDCDIVAFEIFYYLLGPLKYLNLSGNGITSQNLDFLSQNLQDLTQPITIDLS